MGTLVTLKASVSSSGTPVSAGLVLFCNAGATYCEDFNILGQAQLTASGSASLNLLLPVGTHMIRAEFRGTNSNAPSSSSTQSLIVSGKYPTVTTFQTYQGPNYLDLVASIIGFGTTAPTGVLAFKEPNTQTARRTLTVIVVLLGVFLAGIAYLTKVYGIMATEPASPHYQSLLSMITVAVAGRGIVYYVTIASILVLLSLSANTAFADFPRLCRVIAEDGYLPRFFAIRGRRLVYAEGIVVLAVLSALILIAFGGVTDRLIPLFAIGAFLAFTLSQAGMVMHWRRNGGARSKLYMTINGMGAAATGCTVVIVLVAKFEEGAWITVLMVPSLIALMYAVHRYYRKAAGLVTIDHLEIARQSPPLAVVPVSSWNRASQEALQFACSLSPDVEILHIECPGEQGEETSADWQQQLDAAAGKAGFKPPCVVSVASPFRFITSPIVRYVLEAEQRAPDRKVMVVVPELVAVRWYQYLLHNHRSTVLKAMLLVQGNRRIVVVNVPWYLR